MTSYMNHALVLSILSVRLTVETFKGCAIYFIMKIVQEYTQNKHKSGRRIGPTRTR